MFKQIQLELSVPIEYEDRDIKEEDNNERGYFEESIFGKEDVEQD
jgi:hypothetical protein